MIAVILTALILPVFQTSQIGAVVGMKQLLIGGSNTHLTSASSVKYGLVQGGTDWATAYYYRKQLVSAAGTLSSFFVELPAAPENGAGTQSYTFTLMLNEVAQTLSVTISEANTTGSDVSHFISVVPGDAIQLRCTPSGTPVEVAPRYSMVFQGDTPNESLLLSGVHVSTINPTYGGVQGGQDNAGSSTVNGYEQVIPTAGTIDNLYVLMEEGDAGDPPEAYSYTLYLNGAPTTLTTTIVANNLSGNDLVHSVAVVAGDIVYVKTTPINSPTFPPSGALGMRFTATTNGESLLLGNSATFWDDSRLYVPLATGYGAAIWNAAESNCLQGAQDASGAILKSLYIKLGTAPGAGNSHTFYVRTGAGNSAITVQIANAATTGNDVAHTLDLANYDELSLGRVPASSPDDGYANWGLVCYIAPAGSWGHKITGLTTAAKVDGVEMASINTIDTVAH
jgi:hypothetical protein